jgi:hypothetical protein
MSYPVSSNENMLASIHHSASFSCDKGDIYIDTAHQYSGPANKGETWGRSLTLELNVSFQVPENLPPQKNAIVSCYHPQRIVAVE